MAKDNDHPSSLYSSCLGPELMTAIIRNIVFMFSCFHVFAVYCPLQISWTEIIYEKMGHLNGDSDALAVFCN